MSCAQMSEQSWKGRQSGGKNDLLTRHTHLEAQETHEHCRDGVGREQGGVLIGILFSVSKVGNLEDSVLHPKPLCCTIWGESGIWPWARGKHGSL